MVSDNLCEVYTPECVILEMEILLWKQKNATQSSFPVKSTVLLTSSMTAFPLQCFNI